MATQALYLKYRPQTFEEVVGQEPITRTLRNALQQGRLRHAYLLAGPRGTGKTTTARLLAKAVNCLAPEGERPCNACSICVACPAHLLPGVGDFFGGDSVPLLLWRSFSRYLLCWFLVIQCFVSSLGIPSSGSRRLSSISLCGRR